MRYQVNDLGFIRRVGAGKISGPAGYKAGDRVEVRDGEIAGLLNRNAVVCTARQVLEKLDLDERDLLFESGDPKASALVRKLSAYATVGINIAVNSRLYLGLKYLESKGILLPTSEVPRADEIYQSLGGEI